MASKTFAFMIVGLICNGFAFEFADDYIAQHSGCSATNPQQSPVNLNTVNSKYYDERMFRLLSTNYTVYANSTWTKFDQTNGNGLGFEGDFGSTLLMKNWALYKYDLKKIIFRYGSSHTINATNKYDGEIELIHKVDSSYRTNGRYIKESSQYLVISLFMMGQVANADGTFNTTEVVSNLLKELNVNDLKTQTFAAGNANTLPTRRVKLNRIVQNTPQLMYEGRLTYGICEKALYIIDPMYQLIDADSMNNLKAALNLNGFLINNSNSRNIQVLDISTAIFRNDPSITSYSKDKSPFQYDTTLFTGMASIFLYVVLTILLI